MPHLNVGLVKLAFLRAVLLLHSMGMEERVPEGAGAQPRKIRDLHASEHTGSFCTECCMEKNVLSERGNGV